jgi:hypothetical protein
VYLHGADWAPLPVLSDTLGHLPPSVCDCGVICRQGYDRGLTGSETMRTLSLLVVLTFVGVKASAEGRANFVRIHVDGAAGTEIRVIWKPYAGAVGTTVASQQAGVRSMHDVPNFPDSMRRWRDPSVRDTVISTLPVDYVVDMNGGPISIESLSKKKVDLEAQTTRGGPISKANAKSFRISADGYRVVIESQ